MSVSWHSANGVKRKKLFSGFTDSVFHTLLDANRAVQQSLWLSSFLIHTTTHTICMVLPCVHVSRIGVENDEIAIFFSSFSSAVACESIHSLSTRPRHPQTGRLPASALAISKHSSKQAASNAVPRAVSNPRRLQTAPLLSQAQLPPRRQTPHGHRRCGLNTPQRIRLPPRLRPLRSLARRRIRRPPPAPVRRHRGR